MDIVQPNIPLWKYEFEWKGEGKKGSARQKDNATPPVGLEVFPMHGVGNARSGAMVFVSTCVQQEREREMRESARAGQGAGKECERRKKERDAES